MIRLAVLSSDKTSWALEAFIHQHAKYWDTQQPTVIAGYSQPAASLPGNFSFLSLGKFPDYPVTRYSDGLIKLLQILGGELVILMMDDYWLRRPVDKLLVDQLWRYMLAKPSIIRMDLTADRLNSGNATLYDTLEGTKIVRTIGGQYSLSLQAAIWRVPLLMEILERNESPWDIELRGSGRLNARHDLLVLGTNHPPVEYMIGVQQGKLVTDGGYQGIDHALTSEDLHELQDAGSIPVV